MPHSLRAELSKMRHKGYITDEQYKKYIRTLDRYKALERQTGEWIPVSERLPGEGQRVFVTQTVSDRAVVYCTTFPFEKIKEKYIRAWMPLPKPYEPQESEDKE
jgi:hypothetical protein